MMMRETCAFHCGILHVSRFVAWMLAGLVVMTAQWAQAKAYRDGNGLTWYYKEINDDSAIIVNDGDNLMFDSAIDPVTAVDEIVIPEKIYDLQVVGLGKNALKNCDKITVGHIPEGVVTIGQDAFNECSSLTNVFIPNSLTEIGYRAFYKCSRLTDLSIPNDVTDIDADAFYACSELVDITIPASVKKGGDWAFSR